MSNEQKIDAFFEKIDVITEKAGMFLCKLTVVYLIWQYFIR